MDFFPNQNQKHSPKRKKRRLNPDQVRLLERSFTSNNKLDPELKLQLAGQLGIPPRQVSVWYQNKRARCKTQSLELDYSLLQKQLENALVEKRRLEKDVDHLKGELEKAREMIFASKGTGPRVSCNSFSFDESGSSSFHDGLNCSVENGDVWPNDQELYAGWIGEDGSSWE